jgi:hypothetical protein
MRTSARAVGGSRRSHSSTQPRSARRTGPTRGSIAARTAEVGGFGASVAATAGAGGWAAA